MMAKCHVKIHLSLNISFSFFGNSLIESIEGQFKKNTKKAKTKQNDSENVRCMKLVGLWIGKYAETI